MMGLAYLGAAALFLTAMFWVMYWAWQRGRANGGSALRASGFAFAGFLVVYLPVFWNWIPVMLMHRSLCAKDAGFTVYVTPEQWVAENRDRFPDLDKANLEKTTKSREISPGIYRYEFFGGLLMRENRDEKLRHFGFDFWRGDSRILDARTGRVLTKRVDYAGGSPEDGRLWLRIGGCSERNESSSFGKEMMFKSKLKAEVK